MKEKSVMLWCSRASIFLVFFSLFSNVLSAQTDDHRFRFSLGSGDAAGALLFEGEIVAGQTVLEFRRALRQADVSWLVLSSPGGSVNEGILFAETVRDLGLNTAVVAGTDCASACSFVYFAGTENHLQGRVGVHQFRTAQGSNDEFSTQWTAGEIIQVLNGFGVPSVVFERMLQTPPDEMFWFGPEDADLFSAGGVPPRVVAAPVERQVLNGRELISAIQRELNRLGCNLGGADGVIGPRSRAALREYATRSGVAYNESLFQDGAFLRTLQSTQSRVCPERPRQVAVNLSGSWSLRGSCPNGLTYVGQVIVNRSSGTQYSFNYANSLGYHGLGTIRQTGSSATFSLRWSNGNRDNGTFRIRSYNSIAGTDSSGCTFSLAR